MTQEKVHRETLASSYWQMLRQIPRTVWCLGLATALMNASTVIIFSLSPIYLTSVLGLSMLGIGFMEAVVESLAWIMRIVSGILSDFFRKRKIFILASYSLVALSRPIFPLTGSIGWFFLGRTIDRIGNGFQATPREALIADISPPKLKGACFGLRQALGTAGSAVGALVGVSIMHMTQNDYTAVFWCATLPAILAVGLLVFMMEDSRFSSEKTETEAPKKSKMSLSFRRETLRLFPKDFWLVILVSIIFLVGRFSGAFLILKAKNVGISDSLAPIIMVAFNLFSALSAYPIGVLSDRIDRRITLGIGFFFIILADICLAFASTPASVILGVIFWGMQYGITQSIPVAMIADRAPKELRGTAFGIFYLGSGAALFLANIAAGYISHHFGQNFIFIFSGSIIIFAASGLLYVGTGKKKTDLTDEMP